MRGRFVSIDPPVMRLKLWSTGNKQGLFHSDEEVLVDLWIFNGLSVEQGIDTNFVLAGSLASHGYCQFDESASGEFPGRHQPHRRVGPGALARSMMKPRSCKAATTPLTTLSLLSMSNARV